MDPRAFFLVGIALIVALACQPKPESSPTPVKIHEIICPSGQAIEYVRENPMSLSAERKLCGMLEPTPSL